MKTKNAILLIILMIPLFSTAQLWKRSRAEFYFGAGATNFLGDLGGANAIGSHTIKDLNMPATRPVFQVGYSYRFTKQTQLQMALDYGFLYGSDKFTTERFRSNRNLTFRTAIYQFDAKYCLNLSKQRPGHIYNLRGVRGLKNIQIISYVFTGLGFFYFNPKGPDQQGNWVALHPLSTEGEGIYASRPNYHLFQPNIPLGFGFKWLITRDWMVGIEYTYHKTFTDYIDDCSTTYPDYTLLGRIKGQQAVYFSNPSLGKEPLAVSPNMQRGDPSNKDSYMFATITVRYKIPYSRRFLGLPKF